MRRVTARQRWGIALPRTTAALLATLIAVHPALAADITRTLNCTVGKKPMSLVYQGDKYSGTLEAKTPWGDMSFDDASYAEYADDFTIQASQNQPAVVMPDLVRLQKCLNKLSKTQDELMDLNMLQIDTGFCAPKTADGKPVPALVEINVSQEQDYGLDVDVYRTYAADSPVADGHIVIVVPEELSPQCTVADED
jgi:hypothetical protein